MVSNASIIFVVEQRCQCKLPKDERMFLTSSRLSTLHPRVTVLFPCPQEVCCHVFSHWIQDKKDESGWECLFTLVQRMLSVTTDPSPHEFPYSFPSPISHSYSSFREAHPPALLAPVSQVTLFPVTCNVQEGHFCNLQPSPRSHCCFLVSVFIVDSWKSFLTCPSLSLLPLD